MRADIATEEDIRVLVERFYTKLANDATVGHFFAGLDLSHHLPRIRAFWEMVLLGKAGYTTNVTEVHLELARRIPMRKEHFDRWLELWRATLDELFEGPVTEDARMRAWSIAAVIQVKVAQGR